MTVDDPKVSVKSMLCGTGNSLRSATDVTNCLRKREKEGINPCGCLFVQGWVGDQEDGLVDGVPVGVERGRYLRYRILVP